MKLVRPRSLALARVAAGATGWAAQHDQHQGHHPAGSASASAKFAGIKTASSPSAPTIAAKFVVGAPA